MGIKNFHQFMKKRAPNAYKNVHLSEYQGKSVAIDISGLIYKYKILNKERWLDSFVILILKLRKNLIHPIFIFDGQAPKAKDNEKTKRSQQRKILSEKIFNLRESLDSYYSSGEINETLVHEMKRIDGPPALGKTIGINVSQLENRYSQIESQIVKWSEEDVCNLHKIFDYLNIPYTVSPSEAETLCASFALNGKVSAVVSNDSDVCVYGVKKFLYEINGMNEMCVEIDTQEILQSLELTHEEFVDFCIMCGCDYNDNIPNVGPVNAYKLIKQYHSIDNLPKEYPIDILNHNESRSLFSTRYQTETTVIWEEPSPKNIIELYNFLTLKNSRIKIEEIRQVFKPIEIIFD